MISYQNDDGTIQMDEIHPQLRPLIQQFLLKCKYPFKPYGTGRWVYEGENKYCVAVGFFDPNSSTSRPAGTLKWQHGDFGKQNKFRIVTRMVLNSRYRDSERRASVDTQDEKRALKEMLTHIKPFTLQEMSAAADNIAFSAINRWRAEDSSVVASVFGVSTMAMAKEVRNLLALGVEFITPEFQRLATEGLAAYAQVEERKAIRIAKHFVKFNTNGTIDVLAPSGHSTFTAFETLPEFIQETIGILKMTPYKEGESYPEIPGVGAVAGKDVYWVFQQNPPA